MKEIKSSGNPKPSDGVLVQVPPEYWTELKNKDHNQICKKASVTMPSNGIFHIPFFNKTIIADVEKKNLFFKKKPVPKRIENTLLELMTLVYLLNVTSHKIENVMVSVKELKNASFFQGPHILETSHLIKQYGNDIKGFEKAARKLGGDILDLADVSCRLMPFPKIPVYYLLWEGDEEFEASMSILFDKSVEKHLGADAIWGLAHLVSDYLL